MNPISGPFVVQQSIPRTYSRIYEEQQRYRQKKPYNLQLPYYVSTVTCGVVVRGSNAPKYSAADSFNSTHGACTVAALNSSGDTNISWFRDIRDDAINRALQKFNAQLGERSALAVTLAEYRQSLDMIEKRGLQLFRAVRALKRLDFHEVAKQLGVSRHPRWFRLSRSDKLRRESRAFADNWLEYSFGWSPLVSDVVNAAQILGSDPRRPAWVKQSAVVRGTKSFGSLTPGIGNYCTHRFSVRATVGACLVVENPNTTRLHDLGLDNPLSVAYELVPWSFVANWFFNLEEFLAQFNQYLGVRVEQPWYSITAVDLSDYLGPTSLGDPKYDWVGPYSGRSSQRTPGSLPGVVLKLRPAWTLKPKRALNAISLLIQKMPRG